MIHAYSDLYLNDARRTLAGSFDSAVYTFGMKLPSFYDMFLASAFSTKFEKGDPFVVSGMSGTELAALIICSHTGKASEIQPVYHDDKTPEYWAGWALSFYQWFTGCSFKKLNEEVPIETILQMYPKYHEMDISHFNDRLNEIRKTSRMATYLKQYREHLGFSQSELAVLTGIPVRTIQQYEQGQKSINRARADYIISLSNVLNIDPRLLLELS